MRAPTAALPSRIFGLRWHPGSDLLAVAVSWLLVTGSLFTASVIIGPEAGGGLPYFFLYALVAATLFGIGFPVYWTAVVNRRPLSDLGITGQRLGLSMAMQLVFATLLFLDNFARTQLPPIEKLAPLVALALAIGFFEAVFWRGWVQMRLEEAFGAVPAVLLAALLYAAYHIGYAMPVSEMAFLFLIGLIFAVAFRLTGSIFILWPLFQPMGQLVTIIKDGLTLPALATVGFAEALLLMGALVWLAGRYYRKLQPGT